MVQVLDMLFKYEGEISEQPPTSYWEFMETYFQSAERKINVQTENSVASKSIFQKWG